MERVDRFLHKKTSYVRKTDRHYKPCGEAKLRYSFRVYPQDRKVIIKKHGSLQRFLDMCIDWAVKKGGA